MRERPDARRDRTQRRYGPPVEIDVEGARLPLTLALPDGPVHGGCVALHPADNGSRNQPLMQHLLDTLPRHGIAVLLHDRRPTTGSDNVPLRVQASDALAVAAVLRCHAGAIPVGMWGWSQGAWGAAVAAAIDPTIAFLVLVASVGVSPGQQMRHATAEHLRRHGFDEDAVAELLNVRSVYEDALRGRVSRSDAQRMLDSIAGRPWRHLAWLPERLDAEARWSDLDFEPGPVFAATACPVLAIWGEDDPWLPVDDSEAAWRRAAGERLTSLRLPGAGHGPDAGDQRYEQALVAHVLSATAR